ncbi:hypothetical protein GQX73_g4827 [Xylaria multiplex]|uniref:DNA sliding clamp PCNA n=1 Tax=Xylaria multiplex TaxID=323545 RepID=A0A7C8MMG4_9PEZI|nr:hypothetical protein GQX73_g4827 [Xylaria multiplex]
MLEARLSQSMVLKKVVDAIKDLVQDCNFDCNDSGIALQAMDNSHVALVSMLLKAESFEPYRCDRNIALGVNLVSLTKVLRALQNDDLVTLKADDAPDSLNITFESSTADRISEYDLKLMDIDQEHLGIPDTEYAATVTMPSTEFKRICTDLQAMSESVTIEATKDGIKFSCAGDIGNGAVTLRNYQNVEKEHLNVDIELTEPVSLTFSLKYLVNFCKAQPLSDRVKICLSNEVPLLVEYLITGTSYLRFYLAPKVRDMIFSVVSGHVGNKIAVFVLQSLGCDAAALNTVQFSNHTGYRQVKGTKLAAQEITDLWDGLKQSHLDSFDMMLSGYVPGAAGVEAVGRIAKELKTAAASKPGSFFWVLDPVMGDNGKIYVAEDVVPAYQSLIHHADLILPNQFEAEYVFSPFAFPPCHISCAFHGNSVLTQGIRAAYRLLSGVSITDSASLERAIEVLHDTYNLPHIVITSVSLPIRSASQTPSSTRPASPTQSQAPTMPTMSVVGSTRTSDRKPRLFTIQFPVFNAYFSGTGDMFAALMVVRMREAVACSTTDGTQHTTSWLSPDDVVPTDLPLARAAEKVLASMHEVLARTCEQMPSDLSAAIARLATRRGVSEDVVRAESETMHLLRSQAAELKLARNLGCLREPTIEYRAEKM